MKKLLLSIIFLFIISATISVSAAEINLESTGNSENYTNKFTLSENDLPLPESYSSVDYNYVSSVKEQKGNICWAYSGISTLETFLLKNNLFTEDLSPDHMDLWATPDSNGNGWIRNLSDSGYGYITMGYLTSWNGPLTSSNQPINIGITGIRYLDKNNPIEIKKAIMKNGAVTADYNATDEGSNSTETACYISEKIGIYGHSISIVGWDDNYSVDNFDGKYKPKNSGAWLCKNSWGDYNSLGGFFWISYEDYYLLNHDIFSPGYTIEDYHIIEKNHSIYQNEIYGATYEFNYVDTYDDVIYISTFDFSKQGNSLDKVVFKSEAVGAEYNVYYIPFNKNTLITDKDKWFHLQKGIVNYRGYICCDFNDLIVSQGYGGIAIEINTADVKNDTSSSQSGYVKNTIGVCEWLTSSQTKEYIFKHQSKQGECYIHFDDTLMDLNYFYNEFLDDSLGGTFAIKAITNDTINTKITGDLNFDGILNINDATYIQKYLAKFINELMEDQETKADFNNDGKISIKDVTEIQCHLAGIFH